MEHISVKAVFPRVSLKGHTSESIYMMLKDLEVIRSLLRDKRWDILQDLVEGMVFITHFESEVQRSGTNNN